MIEDECTVGDFYETCTPTNSGGSVIGTTIDVTMTDHGDGTYSHTFTPTSDPGKASVSIWVLTGGGLHAKYIPGEYLTDAP